MPYDRNGNWVDEGDENAVSMIDDQDQNEFSQYSEPQQQGPAYGVDDYEDQQRQLGHFDEAVQNLSPQEEDQEGQPGRQHSDSESGGDYGGANPEPDGGGGSYDLAEQNDRGVQGVGFGEAPQEERMPMPSPAGGGYRKWDGRKWVTQDTPGAPVPLGQRGPKADVLHFINPGNGNRGSFELPAGQDGQRLVQDYQRKGYITSVNRPLDRNGRPIMSPQEMQAQQQQGQEKPPEDLQAMLDRATLTNAERQNMAKLSGGLQQVQSDVASGRLTAQAGAHAKALIQAQLQPLQQRDQAAKQIALKLADQQHTQQNAKAQGIKRVNELNDADTQIKMNDMATKAAGDGYRRIVNPRTGDVKLDPVADLQLKHDLKIKELAAAAALAKEKAAPAAEAKEAAKENFDTKAHLANAKAEVESGGNGYSEAPIRPKISVQGTADNAEKYGVPSDAKMHEIHNPEFDKAVAAVMKQKRAEHADRIASRNSTAGSASGPDPERDAAERQRDPDPRSLANDPNFIPYPGFPGQYVPNPNRPQQQPQAQSPAPPPPPAEKPKAELVAQADALHKQHLQVAMNDPDPQVRAKSQEVAAAALRVQQIISNKDWKSIADAPEDIQKEYREAMKRIKSNI